MPVQHRLLTRISVGLNSRIPKRAEAQTVVYTAAARMQNAEHVHAFFIFRSLLRSSRLTLLRLDLLRPPPNLRTSLMGNMAPDGSIKRRSSSWSLPGLMGTTPRPRPRRMPTTPDALESFYAFEASHFRTFSEAADASDTRKQSPPQAAASRNDQIEVSAAPGYLNGCA